MSTRFDFRRETTPRLTRLEWIHDELLWRYVSTLICRGICFGCVLLVIAQISKIE